MSKVTQHNGENGTSDGMFSGGYHAHPFKVV